MNFNDNLSFTSLFLEARVVCLQVKEHKTVTGRINECILYNFIFV